MRIVLRSAIFISVRIFFSRRSCRARSFACIHRVHQNDTREQQRVRNRGFGHVREPFVAWKVVVVVAGDSNLEQRTLSLLRNRTKCRLAPPSRIKHYRGVVLRSLEHIVLMSLPVRSRARTLRLYVAHFQFNASLSAARSCHCAAYGAA